jgi:hypothetical protein
LNRTLEYVAFIPREKPAHKIAIFDICISAYVYLEERDILAVFHSMNGRPCESDREGREEDEREDLQAFPRRKFSFS